MGWIITIAAVLLLTILLLTGCKTQYIPLPQKTEKDSLVTRVNTRVDSIFIDRYHTETDLPSPSGEGLGVKLLRDSIYIEKWRYRDRADTILVTRTDTVTVAVPSPSPSGEGVRGARLRFYRFTAWFFVVVVVVVLLYIATRIAIALYLRR